MMSTIKHISYREACAEAAIYWRGAEVAHMDEAGSWGPGWLVSVDGRIRGFMADSGQVYENSDALGWCLACPLGQDLAHNIHIDRED